MFRHRIDPSPVPRMQEYRQPPRNREIEIAEVDPVPPEDPERKAVQPEPYLPDAALVEAVALSVALGRPLLLQGDPGCGKTRLAYAVAYLMGLPLEECYIKSTSRAQDLLYTYDAVNRLYDAQLRSSAGGDGGGTLEVRRYIRLGPLGRAIARAQHGRRSVVLIDEIDKADIDFPNDLLLELDRLRFKVDEAPEMSYDAGGRPELRPIVIVTHNEEKALPTAFLRRCIFHHIEFPKSEEALSQILALHHDVDEALGRRAVEVVLQLRELDLSKKPGLSELIDWVGYLAHVRMPAADLEKLPHVGALLKQKADQDRALQELAGG